MKNNVIVELKTLVKGGTSVWNTTYQNASILKPFCNSDIFYIFVTADSTEYHPLSTPVMVLLRGSDVGL